MAHNPVLYHWTKHIVIDCHFIREKIIERLIELQYIPTDEQLADALKKTLPSHHLQYLLSKLGMTAATPSLRGDDEDTHPDIT